MHGEAVTSAEPPDRDHPVADRGVTEPGGTGEHQHREPVADLFARWYGPRCLVAAAAERHDEEDRGAGHHLLSNGATAGGNGRAAHGSQDTSDGSTNSAIARRAARPNVRSLAVT
jgi:hypothetical protein